MSLTREIKENEGYWAVMYDYGQKLWSCAKSSWKNKESTPDLLLPDFDVCARADFLIWFQLVETQSGMRAREVIRIPLRADRVFAEQTNDIAL